MRYKFQPIFLRYINKKEEVYANGGQIYIYIYIYMLNIRYIRFNQKFFST